jgi:hypothetical protein
VLIAHSVKEWAAPMPKRGLGRPPFRALHRYRESVVLLRPGNTGSNTAVERSLRGGGHVLASNRPRRSSGASRVTRH